MALPSLVVWDFDLTITKIHTHPHQQLTAQQVVADPETFVETCRQLQLHGVQLAIASFGHHQLIQQVLSELSIDFTYIITPQVISDIYHLDWRDGYQPPFGYSKVTMLNYLSMLTQLPPGEILLIDDSAENCYRAQESGYQIMQVKCFSRLNCPLDPDDFTAGWLKHQSNHRMSFDR